MIWLLLRLGRSFWILDDVTHHCVRWSRVQQQRPLCGYFRPANCNSHALEPPIKERQYPWMNRWRRIPPEGALLDYYLKEKASSPIQLEIFDSEGKLVRRFASDEVLRKTNPKRRPDFRWSGYVTRKPLLTDAGMHRFVWDLRYALPKGVRRSFLGGQPGPMAGPGNYNREAHREREEQHAAR